MTRIVVTGAINWDINLSVKDLASTGEEIPVDKIARVPGGKGANVAVAAARILGSNQVSLLGGLGKDLVAKDQIKILQEEGVDTSGIKCIDNVDSGQAYIVIDQQGRNIIHTFFGANLEVFPDDLFEPRRHSLIREAKVVTIMDPPLETAARMSEIGNELKKIVLWDPGVMCKLGLEALAKVVKNVQYLFVNEVEVRNLTGTNDLTEASDRLLASNREIRLIIKLGARGCVMADCSGTARIDGVPLGEFGLEVVNTVGCGDAFLGVFSAMKTLGLSDIEALGKANLAGAIKATKPETRGSPTRTELEAFASGIARTI